MRILLVNPDNPAGSGRDLYTADLYGALCLGKPFTNMYFGIPLGLPTLAAVTPPGHQVEIVDEAVQKVDFDGNWDLVGITGMTFKAPRAYEIADEFRRRGVPVVMGGIHASMCPDEAATHVDSVVTGEADEIWPDIVRDAEAGRLQPRYQAESAPDISRLPAPRYDLTAQDHYLMFYLQTTRGCPHNCEFCTVTRFNGRRLRKKTPEQVVNEIREIFKLRYVPLRMKDDDHGGESKRCAPAAFFFTDDNFAGSRSHALAVCKALEKLQDEEGILMSWFTQVTCKVGDDDELLEAMRAAGCRCLFMGFESVSEETLKTMNKSMNSPEDYDRIIDNVRAHGMEVVASVILGGESDRHDVGEQLEEFVRRNNIFYVLPNVMTPYPGTKLREKIEAQGRITCTDHGRYNIRNVVFEPALMSGRDLKKAYLKFCENTLSFDGLIERAWATRKYPRRHRVSLPWRLLLLLVFSLTAIWKTLTSKITPAALLKALRAVPRFTLRNNSFMVYEMLCAAVDYDVFARSESARLRAEIASEAPVSYDSRVTKAMGTGYTGEALGEI